MDTLFESRPDFPRPAGPALPVEALRAADVLLSRGRGTISDCIAAADGGSYSHAALWTGSSVIDAREDGVRERPLGTERDVYRFHAEDAPLTGADAAKVVAIARSKLGGRYAFHELYLLGMLFALGSVPGRSLGRVALEALGGANADRLERWLDSLQAGRTPVICTELVALAFYEARADHAWALRVLPIEARPRAPGATAERVWSAASETDPDILTAQARCRSLLGVREAPEAASAVQPHAFPAQSREDERKLLWGSVALQANSGRRLSAVTPADLQFSPSLRFLGRVSGKG